MEWTELVVSVKTEDTNTACDIVGMIFSGGFYLEDYSDLEKGAREIAHIDLIDEALLQKDRTTSLLHVYVSPTQNPKEATSGLTQLLDASGVSYRLDQSKIREEDWANNWKQYFHVQPVGKRLLLVPSWEQYDDSDGREVLRIDPGAAFGTGTHATTRLCLETLETVLKPQDRVLDLGCGSGILSIASCLLGAKSATGVDIDSLAVRTALENGTRNGLQPPRYTMVAGDLTECIEGTFDVIVANIVADVIIRLCPDASNYLAPSGKFVISGIIKPREPDVLAALSCAGLAVE